MGSVHPDAFESALAPIPRNGVVCFRVVPNDLRSTMERCKKHDTACEKALKTSFRFLERDDGEFFVHILAGLPYLGFRLVRFFYFYGPT